MVIVKILKPAATLALGLLAVVFCLQLWRAYVLAPWTRDGRVSAHRDYWDTGEELFARLPLLGALMRFLRRCLGANVTN